MKDDKASVLADNIFFLDEPLHTVWIRFRDKNDFYERKTALKNITDRHRGSSRIKIAYQTSKKVDTLKTHILANEETLEELKKAYGSENIAVTKATYLI